jgi:hypothetical protein
MREKREEKKRRKNEEKMRRKKSFALSPSISTIAHALV